MRRIRCGSGVGASARDWAYSTMPVKSIFQSKTLAANTIALSVALFQHFYGVILPADPQYFALTVAVINIALRFHTSQPVSF